MIVKLCVKKDKQTKQKNYKKTTQNTIGTITASSGYNNTHNYGLLKVEWAPKDVIEI